MANTKPYRETLVSNLYTKEYEKESKNGKSYPSNQVRIDLLSYEWEYESNGKAVAYQWEKIKITNQKRELENGDTVNKKKATYNGRIVDDCTVVSMSIAELNELLASKVDIDTKLNDSPGA